MLDLAQQAGDPVVRVLALRGAVENIGQEPDAAARLPLLERAMTIATRSEERKLVLARLGQIPTPRSLALVVPSLGDPGLVEEAALAAVAVAEKVAAAQPQLATETAAKVLAVARNADALKRAWALRGESFKPGPFLDQLGAGVRSVPTGRREQRPCAFRSAPGAGETGRACCLACLAGGGLGGVVGALPGTGRVCRLSEMPGGRAPGGGGPSC